MQKTRKKVSVSNPKAVKHIEAHLLKTFCVLFNYVSKSLFGVTLYSHALPLQTFKHHIGRLAKVKIEIVINNFTGKYNYCTCLDDSSVAEYYINNK